MKKRVLFAFLGLLLVASVAAAYCYWESWPEGEGSYREAARMQQKLESIRASGKVDEASLPAGFYRLDFRDGSWAIVTGSDSHHDLTGGTAGLLFSDGRICIYFGHVCGPGLEPLAGVFHGDSSIACFAPEGMDWHEFRADGSEK